LPQIDDLCWEYKVLLAWSSVSAGLASFSISETEIEGKDHFKYAASTCRCHETRHASPDTASEEMVKKRGRIFHLQRLNQRSR